MMTTRTRMAPLRSPMLYTREGCSIREAGRSYIAGLHDVGREALQDRRLPVACCRNGFFLQDPKSGWHGLDMSRVSDSAS
jgi:hypothetical protein